MAKTCLGDDCGKEASTLQCPTCQKQGKDSFFCSQDCFKKNWGEHKKSHQSTSTLRSIFPPNAASHIDPATGQFNPFPKYDYTGPLRPVYPLSPKRAVPNRIPKPDYAADGKPRSELALRGRSSAKQLSKAEQEGVRKVCRLAREVLDIAAAALQPGVTTDRIDEIVHEECLKRDSYPSPLNYVNFPKSVCTSINEVVCHGIPDQRPICDGDIINIDVTLYHGGFHGDLNETYYVGSASSDAESIRVVETARECLDEAIELVKPGMLFRDPGNVIEKVAKGRKCGVVRSYCGHGVNQLFHCAPNIPHYAKSKAIGEAKPGMCFTIEPMINLGSYRDQTWDDNWTSVTVDGKRSAQFEHTLLVTETGVEVLTARQSTSPGGPVPIPSDTPSQPAHSQPLAPNPNPELRPSSSQIRENPGKPTSQPEGRPNDDAAAEAQAAASNSSDQVELHPNGMATSPGGSVVQTSEQKPPEQVMGEKASADLKDADGDPAMSVSVSRDGADA